MGIAGGLLVADVAHKRLRPKVNQFCYKVYYLCVSLSKLDELNSLKLCKYNKPALFSIKDKDHLVDENGTMQGYIKNILKEWQLNNVADGDVVLLTMPRIFGYVFNPVSFWFCLDKQNNLRAVLAEVNNTFGENHNYICFHDDKRPIEKDDLLESKKLFHVSPFLKTEGNYSFRFAYSDKNIGAWINYHDENGEMLTTSLVGKRHELNDKSLLACFLRYPLITIKVIFLIHWQALKLVAKGIKYIPKPSPPKNEVSK